MLFFDVVVDLREDSETFLNWCSVELNNENRNMLYVPKGFGHSFVTLEDNTEVTYLVTEVYEPDFERTARWNDPAFKIDWPMAPTSMSEKDKMLGLLTKHIIYRYEILVTGATRL